VWLEQQRKQEHLSWRVQLVVGLDHPHKRPWTRQLPVSKEFPELPECPKLHKESRDAMRVLQPPYFPVLSFIHAMKEGIIQFLFGHTPFKHSHKDHHHPYKLIYLLMKLIEPC
jgi:hypothetical protein